MKGRKKSRVFAILVSVLMVFVMMPMTVCAEAKTSHTVTVVNGTADKVTAVEGEIVTITANDPEDGKCWVQWQSNDASISYEPDAFSTTFTMPDHDVEMTSVYKAIQIKQQLKDQTYTGEAIEPKFDPSDVYLEGTDAALVEGTDYVILYENNENAGTAKATVTFLGHWVGHQSTTFDIHPVDITLDTVTVEADDKVYAGEDLKPSATVTWNGKTLVENEDYLLSVNSVNPGKATLTVTGVGNFEGTKTDTFEIKKRPVTITAADQTIREGESIETGVGKVSLKDAATGHAVSSVTLTEKDGKIVAADAEIRDADENDVTENYVITYKPGKLTVIPKISRKVTFKVVNGSWNDGKTEDQVVTLNGYEGDTLKLKAEDIPAVGSKPSDGYMEGNWDTVPSTKKGVTEDVTYTYSYIEKPEPEPAPAPAKVSGTLMAKMTAKGSNSLVLTWNKIKGAEGYDVFFVKCGKTTRCKKVRTIKAGKKLTWTKKGLKKKRAYKAYVKAWVMKDGKKTYVRKSPTVHAYTSGSKDRYTVAKSITIKSKKEVTLKVGKTYKIKAKINKLDESKDLMTVFHAPKLRYKSTNTKVATVSKSGKIKARGKGTCKIYVFAANGVRKTVKVTVN